MWETIAIFDATDFFYLSKVDSSAEEERYTSFKSAETSRGLIKAHGEMV